MQAQQCGDVLANLFAFHIFASACGERCGFKITLLPPAQPLCVMHGLLNKMRYIKAILFLISVFILHSCDKGRVETKIMDFDQFTIEVPKTWQKLIRPGEDSYLGEIIIDERQKLTFDLGWYSNNLDEELNYKIQDKKVYLIIDFSTPPRRIFEFIGNADTVDIEKLKRQKVEWTIIDQKQAKIVRPKKSGQGITGVYFDSLWTRGSGIDKFQLNGQDLNEENERLLLQAIKTLKFN